MTLTTKEIAVDVASGGAWKPRTLRQVSSNGVDGSTPGGIDTSIGINEKLSPSLIRIIGTDPPFGLNFIQEVGNIQQYTSPGLVRQSQKLYAAIDGNLSNNRNSTSIFSKAIGEKISNGSSRDLYMRYSMKLTSDLVKNQTPQFFDL